MSDCPGVLHDLILVEHCPGCQENTLLMLHLRTMAVRWQSVAESSPDDERAACFRHVAEALRQALADLPDAPKGEP